MARSRIIGSHDLTRVPPHLAERHLDADFPDGRGAHVHLGLVDEAARLLV
jgi:hypothetical protein